jgi:hypothetical protein
MLPFLCSLDNWLKKVEPRVVEWIMVWSAQVGF